MTDGEGTPMAMDPGPTTPILEARNSCSLRITRSVMPRDTKAMALMLTVAAGMSRDTITWSILQSEGTGPKQADVFEACGLWKSIITYLLGAWSSREASFGAEPCSNSITLGLGRKTVWLRALA